MSFGETRVLVDGVWLVPGQVKSIQRVYNRRECRDIQITKKGIKYFWVVETDYKDYGVCNRGFWQQVE